MSTLFFVLLALLAPRMVFAHCPLCTVGAAAAGGVALYFGVSPFVVGIFIGAALFSMGWWFGHLVSSRFSRALFWPVTLGTFALSLFPLLPLFREVIPLYVSMAGEYGSLLHRVYVLDLFFMGSLAGAGIVLISPFVSSKITQIATRQLVPYQGVLVTLVLLVILALVSSFAL
ncbi:MAG: hypothetical protein Q8P70_01490 [bacterium]|nr:hypothetical protein [bacterium]